MKILEVLKIIRKNVKISTLLIMVVLLLFNSFAWFIYATKVSGSMSAHISSWNIEFKVGDDNTETNINFDVDRIYPGMEKYTKEVTVKNTGEVSATISYEVQKIEILGQTYEINTNTDETTDILGPNFPFKIVINLQNNAKLEGNSSSSFSISVEWPFESGNDELDTLWGQKAYEYYNSNPQTKSLHIEMLIEAKQN